jgi:hypothetical protein
MCSSPLCGVDTVLDASMTLSDGEHRRTVCSLCFPGFKRKVLYKAKLVLNVYSCRPATTDLLPGV